MLQSESRLQKEESLQNFSSTSTQRAHSNYFQFVTFEILFYFPCRLATCALGHIIDYTKPDITILCDICKCFLNVSELRTHTTYHNALQLFKFKVNEDNVRIEIDFFVNNNRNYQRQSKVYLNDEIY
jgi:hypothetical protein